MLGGWRTARGVHGSGEAKVTATAGGTVIPGQGAGRNGRRQLGVATTAAKWLRTVGAHGETEVTGAVVVEVVDEDADEVVMAEAIEARGSGKGLDSMGVGYASGGDLMDGGEGGIIESGQEQQGATSGAPKRAKCEKGGS